MKRFLCLLLVLIMVVSAVVSCGGGNVSEDTLVTDEVLEDVTTEEEETEAETEAPVVLKEFDLSQFKIVYSDDAYLAFAETLRDNVKTKSGVELEIAKDGTAGKDGESVLMVGECKRAFSKTALDYSNTTYFDKVGVACDNGRVQILGRERMTINASIDYFIENSVNNNSTVLMIPEDGAFCATNPEKGSTIPKKTTKDAIRVVSNNILLQDLLRSTDRATELFAAYMLMDPDIVGLQEVDMLWHNFYKLDSTMKKMGYEAYPANSPNTRNPIFYKASVFEVVDGAQVAYDGSKFTDGSYPGSSYNWVCLKHKESGKQIIAVSTHFIASMSGSGLTDAQKKEKADTYREESARQLLAAIDAAKKTYPEAAVVVVGDFNNNCSSPAYKLLSSTLNSARDKAPKTANMDYQTYLGQPLGKAPKKGSDKVIDHVFYSGVEAKYFETVISPYTYAYSDHVPVLFDFILK